MITLRIKSENGTLKCEYSEMEKPSRRKYITVKESESDWDKFESSFHELNLSEEAREYLNEKIKDRIGYLESDKTMFSELSSNETECFEVVKPFLMETENNGVLYLKSVPVAENVKGLIHTCKYCGSLTTQSDGECYKAPNNVVDGDGMKSAEEVLRKYIPNFNGSEERFQVMHHASFNSDWDLKMLAAMEEYASQYKTTVCKIKK